MEQCSFVPQRITKSKDRKFALAGNKNSDNYSTMQANGNSEKEVVIVDQRQPGDKSSRRTPHQNETGADD